MRCACCAISGVFDDVAAVGYGFDTLGLRAPDGTVIVEMPDAKTGGADLPATVGARRADLARMLVARAQEVGAKLRFGTTVETLAQDDAGVDVAFSDGSTGRYDLVVGADGVRSHVRSLVGIEVDIAPLGHGHLAGVHAAAPPASSAPTSTTTAPATSRGTARPARTASTPTSSRTRRTAPGSRPTSSSRSCAGSPRTTTGRGTTSAR